MLRHRHLYIILNSTDFLVLTSKCLLEKTAQPVSADFKLPVNALETFLSGQVDWPTSQVEPRATRVARYFSVQQNKTGKNIYQITKQYTKCPYNKSNVRKIDQMSIKYTNVFHCKALPNLPKLRFLVWKNTKKPQFIPNDHKMYPKTIKYTKWPYDIQ
jgi:hypothetical protein